MCEQLTCDECLEKLKQRVALEVASDDRVEQILKIFETRDVPPDLQQTIEKLKESQKDWFGR